MPAAYTRYVGNTKIVNQAEVGDRVLQIAYGKGMGRLEDCGRRGTVVAVSRVRVVVDFGFQSGTRSVHPDVLSLEDRAPNLSDAVVPA